MGINVNGINYLERYFAASPFSLCKLNDAEVEKLRFSSDFSIPFTSGVFLLCCTLVQLAVGITPLSAPNSLAQVARFPKGLKKFRASPKLLELFGR